MANRIKLIQVTDNWYPCISGDKVEVTLHDNESAKLQDYVRVSVWGDDDFGMVMDFDGYNRENLDKANKVFESIPNSGTNREWFLEHGFVEDL